jgi:phage baseplate assembly protein W
MFKFLGVGWQFPVERDESRQHFALAKYEESIKQSIRIILSTVKGERVMRPEFGCGIHELVFAPNDAATRGCKAKSYMLASDTVYERQTTDSTWCTRFT